MTVWRIKMEFAKTLSVKQEMEEFIGLRENR